MSAFLKGLLCLLWGMGAAFAQDLSGQWHMLWDDAGSHTALQVTQPHMHWQPDVRRGNHGYRAGVLWLRLETPASPLDGQRHILVLGQPYIDRIDVYPWGSDEPLATLGDSVPVTTLSAHPTRHAVRLPASSSPQTWLLRVQTTSAMNLSAQLATDAELVQALPQELLTAGAFFTLYLLSAGMYAVSALVLRKPVQLAYAFYLLCLLAIFVGTRQPQMLNHWVGSTLWANWVTGFGIIMALGASALLWAEVLELRLNQPGWFKVCVGIFVLCTLGLATINTEFYRWAAVSAMMGVLLLSVVSMGVALWLMRRPVYRIKLGLYVLAFGLSVATGTLLNLSVANVIAVRPWVWQAFDWSALVHVLLLAVATNWTVRNMERENREAGFRQRLLADQQAQAQSFSAFVGHELLNPLARIGRSAEMLLRDWAGPDRTLRRMMDIRTWAFESGKLVEAFLNDTAIKSGQVQVRPVPVNLAEWMRGVETEFTLNYPQASLQLEWAEATAPVVLDPLLAKLALENLLINALKYAGQQAHITVGARVQGNGVVLVVDDEGPGLQPGQYAQVGVTALQRPPTHEQPGFGLGLSLVATIAKAHGGSLQAQPRQPRGVRWVLELGQLHSAGANPSDPRPSTNA